jgi:hypothetical protein
MIFCVEESGGLSVLLFIIFHEKKALYLYAVMSLLEVICSSAHLNYLFEIVGFQPILRPSSSVAYTQLAAWCHSAEVSSGSCLAVRFFTSSTSSRI